MSLEMVNAVAALGFTTLSVTPHQRARVFLPSPDRSPAPSPACARGGGAFPHLELELAAENYWDEVLLERLSRGVVPHTGKVRRFFSSCRPR